MRQVPIATTRIMATDLETVGSICYLAISRSLHTVAVVYFFFRSMEARNELKLNVYIVNLIKPCCEKVTPHFERLINAVLQSSNS